MIGEIRDLETAQIAVQASLTGHLVFSTLHTNDAVSVFTRLTDMGLEPFLVASALRTVLAQRLVRRLCPAVRGAELRRPTAVLDELRAASLTAIAAAARTGEPRSAAPNVTAPGTVAVSAFTRWSRSPSRCGRRSCSARRPTRRPRSPAAPAFARCARTG